MRIARVIGTVTLSRKLPELRAGRLVIAEALDDAALAGLDHHQPRAKPMPESLIVFDELNAGLGQLIAVSEWAAAMRPFYPVRIPIDAYNAAILDTVEVTLKDEPAATNTPS